MLLAEAHREHQWALRASLRAEYGIALRELGMLETAELLMWLPPGCALWRAFGGDLALNEEAHQLRLIEYRLRVLAWLQTKDAKSGRNRPEPPKPIPTAGKRDEGLVHAERQAAAYRRRTNRR